LPLAHSAQASLAPIHFLEFQIIGYLAMGAMYRQTASAIKATDKRIMKAAPKATLKARRQQLYINLYNLYIKAKKRKARKSKARRAKAMKARRQMAKGKKDKKCKKAKNHK
jgi:hypothetical protein